MEFGFSDGRGKIVSGVNVIPLIDILLVLLIIFVIIPHRQMGLQESLAAGSKAAGSRRSSRNDSGSGRIGWLDSSEWVGCTVR
jgi:biopolymer transport protein ExbD